MRTCIRINSFDTVLPTRTTEWYEWAQNRSFLRPLVAVIWMHFLQRCNNHFQAQGLDDRHIELTLRA